MSYNNVDVNKNNIFKYRRSKKLTQDNIATYLGIKRSTYARQELTGHMPRQQLQKLADLFGVTVFDLLGETSLQFFQPLRSDKNTLAAIENETEKFSEGAINNNSLFLSPKLEKKDNSTLFLTKNESNIIRIYRSLKPDIKKEFEKALCRIAGLDNDKTKKE